MASPTDASYADVDDKALMAAHVDGDAGEAAALVQLLQLLHQALAADDALGGGKQEAKMGRLRCCCCC